jgi:YVTN family beta-propeller protein
VAITPDGARAYVTDGQAETVSVIDTATNTVIATIAAAEGAYPNEVAISPW